MKPDERTLIKLDFSADILFDTHYICLQIHEKNLTKLLAAFSAILCDKNEQVEFVGSGSTVIFMHGGKKYASGAKDDRIFHYNPSEQMLKTIVAILSDIALGRKFGANHIDLEFVGKPTTFGLTLQFAENFYKARLAWER